MTSLSEVLQMATAAMVGITAYDWAKAVFFKRPWKLHALICLSFLLVMLSFMWR